MTVKGGTSPACAACKFQRRKCSPECPLAPYFPASETNIFQNAHKLFGVSNMRKILDKLNSREQRDEAMKSIKFESYLRERFPIDGCVGYINLLQQQLFQYVQELHYVYARLAICREERHDDQLLDHHYSPSSELQLGMNSIIPILSHHSAELVTPFEANPLVMNENKGFYVDCNEDMTRPLWAQDVNYNHGDHHEHIAIMIPSHAFPAQQETDVVYNDMLFDSLADDRQSYIESKEVCDSSCESSWKGTAENVSKHELKSAAACFSLTSVN